MKITTDEVRETTSILDEIVEQYKKQSVDKKRDWRTYEENYVQRIKIIINELRPLIKESIGNIKMIKDENRGNKPKLDLEQKVTLLLLKHLFGKSNRMMANMLALFSLLTEVDISYKTVERLYSDNEVLLALQNLHELMLKKKEVKEADTGGDGTGYSLSVKEHYASNSKLLKKKKSSKKSKCFFSFSLMDIKTRMYVAYGTSFKSERDAYNKAKNMAEDSDIIVKSIRLDKYFSGQQTVRELKSIFPYASIFLIPKSNATVRGPWEWKRMLHDFVNGTFAYVQDYYQRNQSESGFAEDKKRTGWRISQRREERMDTADFLTKLWHNLFWLEG